MQAIYVKENCQRARDEEVRAEGQSTKREAGERTYRIVS